MFNSKAKKYICLIIGLFALLGISFGVFYHKNNKDMSSINIQSEQVTNDNTIKENSVKEKIKKVEVLNPAQKYYKDYLAKDVKNFLASVKTSKNNDLAFSKLQNKFMKAAEFLNEKYPDKIDITDIYYQKNWIKLSCVEGVYLYAVNSDYLLEKYGQYLSNSYREWLKFIIKREAVMQDGGFTVPPDTLREYIIYLEKFTDQNTDFILISDAKGLLKNYLMIYLEGIDNSPVFDKWNTGKMKPEFKTSYEKFLSENKDSKYYSMVKELYDKSKSNDFTWDKDFDTWLLEYNKKYFTNN